MDYEELIRLARFAADSKGEVEALEQMIAALRASGKVPPALFNGLSARANTRAARSRGFPIRPDMLGETGTVIGAEQSTGRPFYWQDHCKSCLIMGSIGGGKTNLALGLIEQLVARGATVWIFDRRRDYSALMEALADTFLVPWESLRINLTAPPPGVSDSLWLGKVSETFCHAYDLLTGSRSLFEEVLLDVHASLVREGKTMTFIDVCDRFARKDYLPHRTRADTEYRGRIYDRLRLLRRKTIEMFGCQRGFDLVKLSECQRAVIFDFRAEDKLRDFVLLTLIWYVWCYRSETPCGHPPLVLVLDEARYTLRERRGSLEHFVLDIDQLLTGSRPFNMGFILIEQVVSQLSRAVVNNTELKVAFNSQAQEISHVASIMGLNREQREKLRSLEVGECIVSLSGGRCPVPALVRTPCFETDPADVGPERLKAAVERTIELLGKDVIVGAEHRPASPQDALDENEVALLHRVSQEPFESLGARRVATGLANSAFYSIVTRLTELGMIRASFVKTPGPGRPMKLLALTERGRAALTEADPDTQPAVYEGGPAHAFWVATLAEALGDTHHVQSSVRLPSGRILDLLVDGSLAIEVEASENVSYDAAKYRAILKDVPQLVVAVEEANASNLLQKLCSAVENGLDEQERGRIRLDLVQTVVQEMS